MKKTLLFIMMVSPFSVYGNAEETEQVATISNAIESKVIQWRRHFHQYPELSNREFETAEYIAKYLKTLGLEVQTGVAHTGVVAILDSGKPGPVVALRADIDALPVTETADLPFSSKVTTMYEGNEVGVMHACGHDTHAAMLMGAAHVLVKMKDKLKGKVKFIFQPAEEGAPGDEEGGAELMVKEGVLESPKVDVIFGLHINSLTDIGTIKYRAGGIMAAVDPFSIVVKGKQSHGAYPWLSVDPIVTSAQIIMGLQTIVSREVKLIDNAAVVSIGSIHGGNRSNIIPNEVKIKGTIRTLDDDMRTHILESVRRKATSIAKSMNATVEIKLPNGINYPVTYNQPELMAKMLPTLNKTVGKEHVEHVKAVMGAEDFSFFQQKVPGLYLFVGGKSKDKPLTETAGHHTPDFVIDDSGLTVGVELLSNLTLDYMQQSSN
jgi:amidohydrolase